AVVGSTKMFAGVARVEESLIATGTSRLAVLDESAPGRARVAVSLTPLFGAESGDATTGPRLSRVGPGVAGAGSWQPTTIATTPAITDPANARPRVIRTGLVMRRIRASRSVARSTSAAPASCALRRAQPNSSSRRP